MSEKETMAKVMGWEETRRRENETVRKRMVLSGKEVRAVLPVLVFFGVSFLLSCYLAGNPFENTVRINSPAILKKGSFVNSDSWGLIGIVVFLGIVFEFLDSAAGMGYGTAFTPLLLILGYDPMQIVPVIMIQQACAGLSSSYLHKEWGNIEWRLNPPSETVKLWAIITIAGCVAVVFSITSVYAIFIVAKKWIKLYVCLLLFIMGITSLLGRRKLRPYKPNRMFLFGALAGFNKGIGGGGYGPVVTVGGILSGIPVKSMTAITALSEGSVCVVSIIIWFLLLQQGVVIDFVLLPSMILGSAISVLLAPYAVRILPEKTWKFFIPAYCCVIGGLSLWKLLPSILSV